MTRIKGFTHLATITLFLCGSVSPATLLKDKESYTEQDSDVKTNFVSAVQIREMETDSEENVMDHKLKMSLVDKADPESSPKNVVYLLKDKELKGFLRTLPIEMLRKLRTLASRDLESAQNFLIKLARERKRKAFESTERLGKLDSEAKPLTSPRNFSRSFVMNNAALNKELISSINNANSNSGFLSGYKFGRNISNAENVQRNDIEQEQSQSQWTPIVGTPPSPRENTSTVTYIVHEVVYPKNSRENSLKSTTENYPSLQQPIQNPSATTPSFIKSGTYNYKPAVLHPVNSMTRQKSILLDNYYGASRQVQDGQAGGGTDNMNRNPTLLLHHVPQISDYGWTIHHTNSPTTNSFNTPVSHVNSFNVMRGPVEFEKQELDNSEYLNLGTDGNSNKNIESQKMYIQTNQPMGMNGQSFFMDTSNQPNRPNVYPSPSSYYTMKPFTVTQNPESYSTANTNTNNVNYNVNNGLSPYYYNNLHGWSADSHPQGDHHSIGFWSKAKSYFYKGDRTAAEKIFEMSLGILAFLAFGGYIFMLLYQVFAINAGAPLFPLVTQRIPVNPSLFGVLFGRSFNSPKGSSLLDLYLNRMERKVKLAITKFRAKLIAQNKRKY